MTALVSLLFITMIPIDCKITNFSYTLRKCNHYEVGDSNTKILLLKQLITYILTVIG